MLQENGRGLASKRTRLMHMRYFSVKDCIASGEILVEHCLNKNMIANFFKLLTSPPGTGSAAHGVIRRKRLSYPKTKYPGTDNKNIEAVMGPASFEEPVLV